MPTKFNKVICLSEEVFFKLREVNNASALIDSLLFKHFKEQENPEEIKKKIAILEARMEANKKIGEIKQNGI